MKKIITGLGVLVMMCLVVGCGINCSSKPPKIATIESNGGYGMQYHITIYVPTSFSSHNDICTKFGYDSVNLYLDKLGKLKGSDIVWKNFENYDFPFEENDVNIDDIRVIIESNNIKIYGIKGGLSEMNGVYMIESSAPNL